MTTKPNLPPRVKGSVTGRVVARAAHLSRLEGEHIRINELLKKAMQAFMRQAPPPEVNGILLELSGYTLTHFREEEELMRSYAFPGLKAHKEEHDRMATEIRGLLDVRCKQEALRSAVSALDLWLEAHIRTKDREFRDFVKHRAE